MPAAGRAPFLLPFSKVREQSGALSNCLCGLLIVLMSFGCVITAPLWPGRATRRGSSRNPPPYSSFMLLEALASGQLTPQASGVHCAFVLISDALLSPSLPLLFLLPLDFEASSVKLRWGKIKAEAEWITFLEAGTIPERNAGQERACGRPWGQQSAPHLFSPPAFVSL